MQQKAAKVQSRMFTGTCDSLEAYMPFQIELAGDEALTPPILESLCDHLLEKPGLYLDEMVVFLWDEFHTLATTSSIRKALASKGWSKKTATRHCVWLHGADYGISMPLMHMIGEAGESGGRLANGGPPLEVGQRCTAFEGFSVQRVPQTPKNRTLREG